MSQYKFTINGKEFDVTVNSVEGKNAAVTVNGVDYNVVLESGLDGSHSSSAVSHPLDPTADAVPLPLGRGGKEEK